MANGHVCCVLAVCCAPGSAEQRAALVEGLMKGNPKMLESKAQAAASRILEEHDQFKKIPKIVREFAA